ncbi:hypothetical protein RU95_GL000564 [Enterococcus avium]|nr:hypothetical protein RU95_GL000564 [Enterococcus avium]
MLDVLLNYLDPILIEKLIRIEYYLTIESDYVMEATIF